MTKKIKSGSFKTGVEKYPVISLEDMELIADTYPEDHREVVEIKKQIEKHFK
jgi:hypothetical protein